MDLHKGEEELLYLLAKMILNIMSQLKMRSWKM